MRQNDRALIAGTHPREKRSKRRSRHVGKVARKPLAGKGQIAGIAGRPARCEISPRRLVVGRRNGGGQRTVAIGAGAGGVLEDTELRRRRIAAFRREIAETDAALTGDVTPTRPTLAAATLAGSGIDQAASLRRRRGDEERDNRSDDDPETAHDLLPSGYPTEYDFGAHSSSTHVCRVDGCNQSGKFGVLDGAAGFEPANGGIKIHCLTTWRRPNGAVRARAVHRNGVRISASRWAGNRGTAAPAKPR